MTEVSDYARIDVNAVIERLYMKHGKGAVDAVLNNRVCSEQKEETE